MVQAYPWTSSAPSTLRSVGVRAAARLRLELIDATDTRVESIWRVLEHAARPAYFLTWGWLETWLSELPAGALPSLAVLRDGATAVAAGFVGRRRVMRHGVLPLRGAFLNATGVAQLDELCIEHNGLVSLPGIASPLAALVAQLPRDWDELALPAIDAAAAGALLRVGDDCQVRVDREVAAPFVDLARVRATGDYIALLSANTRSQLRRARKLIGPCELEVARSAAHATDIYDELVALHTASWRARGEPGAFADPWFTQFHRQLIARRLASGEIQLLRLRARGRTVGCTYNLIANGRVLFYQSGLAAFDDARIKPGYLCHAAAIEHAALAGHAVYDLLAGHARYKASLSTGAARLVWVRLQRRLVRFALEDRLAGYKRAVAAWYAARST